MRAYPNSIEVSIDNAEIYTLNVSIFRGALKLEKRNPDWSIGNVKRAKEQKRV
jgi:hypothetical protein